MIGKSLFEELQDSGWVRILRTSDRMLTDGSGNKFPTFERDGVRICIGTSRSLGVYKGLVTVYDSCDPQDIAVWQVLVEKHKRRKGKARMAIREVARLADGLGLRLYLEPAPTYDKPVGRTALIAFYRSEGFLPIAPGEDKVLVRYPAHGA